MIYLPHERLRVRLNEAFGAGWYKFVPVGDPVLGGYEVIWRYRLAFRDGSEAEAAGHASFIKNNASYSYGDALETCKSDAFTRCCKDVGIGLQVWNRDYQIYFMQTYGVQVPMLNGKKDQWRRKDRPPLPGERQSERQQGPDYERRSTVDEENREHIASLNPSRTAQRFDKQLKTVSKEEACAPGQAEDEELRRHFEEEAAFADDSRED